MNVPYNSRMTKIEVTYEGELRCEAIHGPSGNRLTTDAPVDNEGRGEAFSPTDLVATALGTCMLTVIGIVARRHEIDVRGAKVIVTKEMVTQPRRRIGRLGVTFTLPASLSEENRQRLQNAAMTCPVHQSLHPDVQIDIAWQWE